MIKVFVLRAQPDSLVFAVIFAGSTFLLLLLFFFLLLELLLLCLIVDRQTSEPCC